MRTPTPIPTAQPPPLPTPTPWGETLFYSNNVPALGGRSPGDGNSRRERVLIRVQWTGVAEADHYELLITDGMTVAGRTEETNGAVERAHSWRAPASSDASRVRVRAVKKGAPYSATVSNVDNNRVVIPSGQTAYSPFSAEQLISTNITSMVLSGCANQIWRRDGQLSTSATAGNWTDSGSRLRKCWERGRTGPVGHSRRLYGCWPVWRLWRQ